MINEYYSCKYTNSRQNFVLFTNRPKGTIKESSIEYSIFCVIRNILQRGTRTIPSKLLQEKLGEIDFTAYSLSSDKLSEWTYTIKGDDDNGYYPARDFFNIWLPSILPNGKQYIRNLVLPEAKIQDIIDDKADEFRDQRVDFYFPQIKKAIEIDGAQHESIQQRTLDQMRKRVFEKSGIKTIRIKASEIRNSEMRNLKASFKKKLDSIAMEIEEEEIYIPCYIKGVEESKPQAYKYDAVIRCQMLILFCLMNGYLSLNCDTWRINVCNEDITYLEECLCLACEDISLYFENIVKLLNLPKFDKHFPKIKIVESIIDSDICIDFSLFSKYDESQNDERCIYVRNDYYDLKKYNKVAFGNSLKYDLNIDREDDKSSIEAIKYLLHNLFFLEDFRKGQLPVIANILNGNDTIGIMPTGTGKSLCYQLCALLQPAITIVVVPIIALMHDQLAGLNARHINCCEKISSEQDGEEKEKILKEMAAGKYQIVFISPERFQNKNFRNQIANIANIAFAVIDEVHCLSEWGHDFRVSYLQLIPVIRKHCAKAKIIGLTATASNTVLTDLKIEFGFSGSENIKAFDKVMREELVFKRKSIPRRENKVEGIKTIINELKQSLGDDLFELQDSNTTCGIIFSPTANGIFDGCESLNTGLSRIHELLNNIRIYHGQLSRNDRNKAQEEFMQNKIPILICTKAFGIGIDKPNIRYTIHCALPQSMESFYQEAGRAGRSGISNQKSYCYILYTPDRAPIEIVQEFFNSKTQASRRKMLRSKHFSYCDLDTVMFLFGSGRLDIDEENEKIQRHLTEFKLQCQEQRPYMLKFNTSNELKSIQLALYKMFLLNVVKDWTIEYQKLEVGFVTVEGFELDETGCREKVKLIEYIKKYESDFSLEDNDEYACIFQEYPHMPIRALFKILIKWTNEHIVYNRLQSTYNMREICSENVTDADFYKALEDYFKYTDETIKFDNIVESPNEYARWFDLLYAGSFEKDNRKRIDKNKAKSAFGALRRYLESYAVNTGLNYLAGMLRLYTEEYESTEGEERLRNSFNKISKFKKEDQEKILIATLDFAKIFNMKHKNCLSEVLLNYYREKTSQVYEILQDQVSLALIVKEKTQELKRMMESREKWARTMNKN
ncbi:MAG: RecQ family ATP-dependent DNA helicase [Pusillimonas sp.]